MFTLRWHAVFFLLGFFLMSSAVQVDASNVLRYNFRWDKQQYTVLVGTGASLSESSQTEVRIDVKEDDGAALTGTVVGLPGSSTRPLKDGPPVAAMVHIKGFPVPVIRIVLWNCGASNCSAYHYYFMPHFFNLSRQDRDRSPGVPVRLDLAQEAQFVPDMRPEVLRGIQYLWPVSSKIIFAVDRTTEGYIKTDYYFSFDKSCGGTVTVFKVIHGNYLPREMVVGNPVPSHPFEGHYSTPYRARAPSDEASIKRAEAAFEREGC